MTIPRWCNTCQKFTRHFVQNFPRKLHCVVCDSISANRTGDPVAESVVEPAETVEARRRSIMQIAVDYKKADKP